MKNAIAIFVKEHPYITTYLVLEVISGVKDAIVGVSQAITGNYPPTRPEPTIDIDAKMPDEGDATDNTADSTESD